MAVAPSFDDLIDVGRSELTTRRPDLIVAEGDITLAQLHAAAAMNDAAVRFMAKSILATFLDGATDDELTALVDDHYNIQRQEATAAQVTVTFTRPDDAGDEPAGTIPSGTLIATQIQDDGSQVQFATDVDLPFSLNQLSGSVAATAVETGRDGNVGAGLITRIINIPSFDSTFTVTNAATAGGGNDQESDEELRERARSFFTTLRRGTLVALEYGALQVASVRVATAKEDGYGLVTVIVSDADGNSTQQMISDVEVELENWRCAGVNVTVVGGSQVLVNITLTIDAASPGYDIAAATPGIQTAIEARVNRLGAEEKLYLDTIIATVIATDPDDIFDISITAPSADVTPSTGQIIRAGTISVS